MADAQSPRGLLGNDHTHGRLAWKLPAGAPASVAFRKRSARHQTALPREGPQLDDRPVRPLVLPGRPRPCLNHSRGPTGRHHALRREVALRRHRPVRALDRRRNGGVTISAPASNESRLRCSCGGASRGASWRYPIRFRVRLGGPDGQRRDHWLRREAPVSLGRSYRYRARPRRCG